mmetsp:Transcript_16844/g.58635  ORF Transcript_16844/g.58635 Transcript_16844/m.58635 type:complete len:403 (-) Transcript_16844:289-1497(-)
MPPVWSWRVSIDTSTTLPEEGSQSPTRPWKTTRACSGAATSTPCDARIIPRTRNFTLYATAPASTSSTRPTSRRTACNRMRRRCLKRRMVCMKRGEMPSRGAQLAWCCATGLTRASSPGPSATRPATSRGCTIRSRISCVPWTGRASSSTSRRRGPCTTDSAAAHSPPTRSARCTPASKSASTCSALQIRIAATAGKPQFHSSSASTRTPWATRWGTCRRIGPPSGNTNGSRAALYGTSSTRVCARPCPDARRSGGRIKARQTPPRISGPTAATLASSRRTLRFASTACSSRIGRGSRRGLRRVPFRSHSATPKSSHATQPPAPSKSASTRTSSADAATVVRIRNCGGSTSSPGNCRPILVKSSPLQRRAVITFPPPTRTRSLQRTTATVASRCYASSRRRI